MAFDLDKFFMEMQDSLKGFMDEEYTERQAQLDLKAQEKTQDVTGNYEFWGIE